MNGELGLHVLQGLHGDHQILVEHGSPMLHGLQPILPHMASPMFHQSCATTMHFLAPPQALGPALSPNITDNIGTKHSAQQPMTAPVVSQFGDMVLICPLAPSALEMLRDMKEVEEVEKVKVELEEEFMDEHHHFYIPHHNPFNRSLIEKVDLREASSFFSPPSSSAPEPPQRMP